MFSWKERYFDLVDGLNVGVYRNTPGKEGRFLEVNAAMVSIFEAKSKAELLQVSVSSIYANPRQRAKFSQKIMRQGFVKNEELRLKTLKGNLFWASVTAVKKIKKDKSVYFMGIVEDITSRKKREEKIRLLNQKLSDLSLKDPHTGLFNYRYLEPALKSEISFAKRKNAPFAVFMLDLDYFKSINDVYGHQFGDLVLRQFAQKLKSTVRAYDTLIRYGGEEFVIIGRGLNYSTAKAFAQRLQEEVKKEDFGTTKKQVKLKFSLGITIYPQKINSPLELVDKADAALNVAKEGGKGIFSFYKKDKSFSAHNKEAHSGQMIKDIILKMNNVASRLTQNMWEEAFAFAKKTALWDGYSPAVLTKVEKLADKFALSLGLKKDERELLRKAVILRDLGKSGVSRKILQKKSLLSEKEWLHIKAHPQLSAEVLRNIPFSEKVIPAVLYHHERWDGQGYLYALAGKDIPYLARIVAILDSFQALISQRPWRKAYSLEEAKKIIANEAGKKFDPQIVAVFLRIFT